ncbi:hypothetical protein SLS55_005628 [Diplodia seriata]|uniref:Uncharacterized protein n=1 Tax=Diplodia seriata TaxID=420778 RepID=A0ABR3CGX3_9PEZI
MVMSGRHGVEKTEKKTRLVDLHGGNGNEKQTGPVGYRRVEMSGRHGVGKTWNETSIDDYPPDDLHGGNGNEKQTGPVGYRRVEMSGRHGVGKTWNETSIDDYPPDDLHGGNENENQTGPVGCRRVDMSGRHGVGKTGKETYPNDCHNAENERIKMEIARNAFREFRAEIKPGQDENNSEAATTMMRLLRDMKNKDDAVPVKQPKIPHLVSPQKWPITNPHILRPVVPIVKKFDNGDEFNLSYHSPQKKQTRVHDSTTLQVAIARTRNAYVWELRLTLEIIDRESH